MLCGLNPNFQTRHDSHLQTGGAAQSPVCYIITLGLCWLSCPAPIIAISVQLIQLLGLATLTNAPRPLSALQIYPSEEVAHCLARGCAADSVCLSTPTMS